MSAKTWFTSTLHSMLHAHKNRTQQLDPVWALSLKLWFGFGMIFLIWTIVISTYFSAQILDDHIISQPSENIPEYSPLQGLFRYDVIWYVDIARYGYGHRDGDTGFHPLLPLLMAGLGPLLGGSTSAYVLAGTLISYISTLLLLVLFYRLLILDLTPKETHFACFLLLSNPLAWVLFIPYTESLLLLWSIAAIYAARKSRWWLAGIAGALAALTKQPGTFLIAPLLWELWKQHTGMTLTQRLNSLVGIMLTPMGLLLWIVYRATLGDLPIQWDQPMSILRALMISPSVNKTWEVAFGWPWITLQMALQQHSISPSLFLTINMLLAAGMLIMCLAAITRLRGSLLIYTLVLLIPTLMIVQTLQPFAGIGRRFLIIFPMYAGVASFVWFVRYRYFLVGLVGGMLWLLISFLFMLNRFLI